MTEYVVDAYALIAALSRKDAVGTAVRKIFDSSRTHAPALIDAEAGQVLRRLERRGEITSEVAQAGLYAVEHFIDERYEHGPFLRAAWRLRHTITFYDGLYVTLAAALDLPLLTSDEKLTNAPGLSCAVQLIR